MKALPGQSRRWLLLVLGLCCAVTGAIQAQQPVVPTTHAIPAAPPPVPELKSPVNQFRELLALPAAERESRLTNRPPEIRKRILAKLQEYEAMKPDERELQLRTTQLRWYLVSFRGMSPNDRATQVAMVPEADRELVKSHLDSWDRLPSDEQKDILAYEKALEAFQAQRFTNANALVPPPPPSKEALKNLNAFLQLPPEKRGQMYADFQEFFQLSEAEREKALGTLSPNEQLQITAALRKFEKLPTPQRDRCLKSLAKFSNMSETERGEFLKNAERWRELSSEERQAWRNLINKVAFRPPLPPSIIFPPMPPMPSRSHLQVNVPLQTNSLPQ